MHLRKFADICVNSRLKDSTQMAADSLRSRRFPQMGKNFNANEEGMGRKWARILKTEN